MPVEGADSAEGAVHNYRIIHTQWTYTPPTIGSPHKCGIFNSKLLKDTTCSTSPFLGGGLSVLLLLRIGFVKQYKYVQRPALSLTCWYENQVCWAAGGGSWLGIWIIGAHIFSMRVMECRRWCKEKKIISVFGWVRFRNGEIIYKALPRQNDQKNSKWDINQTISKMKYQSKKFHEEITIKFFPGFHLSGEVSPAQCGGVGEQDRLKVSVSFDRWETTTIIIVLINISAIVIIKLINITHPHYFGFSEFSVKSWLSLINAKYQIPIYLIIVNFGAPPNYYAL